MPSDLFARPNQTLLGIKFLTASILSACTTSILNSIHDYTTTRWSGAVYSAVNINSGGLHLNTDVRYLYSCQFFKTSLMKYCFF